MPIHSRIKTLILPALLLAGTLPMPSLPSVTASECPDVTAVFVRGSGGALGADENYLAFKSALEAKLATTPLNYNFVDLDYPAVAVGIDNLETSLGALVSGGEAYAFGESVNAGVTKLTNLINSSSCKNTKYVIGGYSQGAMVISKALGGLDANKIIYAATFGDPKLYLPEGEGIFPAACRNENLSNYRMYVPDCYAYEGLLGSYKPYQPEDFIDKLGTWCNKNDVFCSSHFNIDDHLAYVSNDLYEDASKVMFDKIIKHFEIESRVSSPHDTAILIDSTGSMAGLIGQYKAEAMRLANETFAMDGRVALYEYRDLNDPFEVKERCVFETCTPEKISEELDGIVANGGGDERESLLSSALSVMQSLNWRYGATKSLIVLTDAGYLNPDRDGVTLEQVVNLSRSIDPVNFYIITNSGSRSEYEELARATDGMVVANFDEVTLITDYILDRYDSLPRVELAAEPLLKPTLTITGTTHLENEQIKVDFTTNASRVLVILNDTVLGYTEQNSVVLNNLDSTKENILSLVPVAEDVKGAADTIKLPVVEKTAPKADVIIPKTPNTGIFSL